MEANKSLLKLVVITTLFGLFLFISINIFLGDVAVDPSTQGGDPTDGYPGPEMDALATGSPTETPVIWQVQVLREYEEALKKEHLSPEMRDSLEKKIEIYRRVATEIEMSRHITVTPEPAITRRFLPTATLFVGLREGGSSDFHNWEAIIQNIWSQYANNHEHITVYAGELGSETKYPGRGVLYVLRRTAAGRGGNRKEYMLPEGTGWVRISEVKGDILVLTSKEGDTFYFYLPGQEFVSSLTDTAPTVTPLPTPGPLSTRGPRSTLASPYP